MRNQHVKTVSMQAYKLETVSRNRLGVIHNSYQGNYTKVLCVCSAGCLRSPTAAHLLASPPWNFNTRSCGLDVDWAIVPISAGLLEWSNEIVVMDSWQYDEVVGMLKILDIERAVHNLEIEDVYAYRDPELVKIMQDKFYKYLFVTKDDF
jgi:predicted protein tyrosine phosphatase